MALINTYTAAKCGPSVGPSYEVAVAEAAHVPEKHLGAVTVSTNPDVIHCCVIDRSQVNQTEESLVKPVQDSGFMLDECQQCQSYWS